MRIAARLRALGDAWRRIVAQARAPSRRATPSMARRLSFIGRASRRHGIHFMRATVVKVLKRGAALLAMGIVLVMAWRVYDSLRAPALERWHTFVPHEPSAAQIGKLDWAGYLEAEKKIFDEVRTEVTDKLEPEARIDSNRYFRASPIYPGRFAQDWNRSYILAPPGKPVGAVVLLHGLTDSPYSLRHVARRYVQDGYVAVAIRLPGHGSVPAGLSKVEWEQWTEATRLAVREARRLAPAPAPLHVIGFSNGGALAMKYALDALDDKTLARPDRIVLFSPMIGITSMARFAGVFGWPAFIPAFDKAAWLGIVPEFNPFKYNSFPVNGARQSSLVARTLQAQINRHAGDGRLQELAPVLTFQSVVDFTVSTRAIVSALYGNLPANGSELVLFDLNRNAMFGPLLRRSTDTVLERLLPEAPRNFRTTVITNAGRGDAEVVERVTEAGATTEQTRELGLRYPRDVFSLSHLALPFPMNDPLYGLEPDTSEDYGANLGAMATRGERGTLIVSIDSLARMSSNPFFPYVMQRVEEGIGRGIEGAKK
jgi:alpha-beta hydrolase superfamily lysophospholipase